MKSQWREKGVGLIIEINNWLTLINSAWLCHSILLQCVVSIFSNFVLKVKDSWDVDSDEESEDKSDESGVYVKKKKPYPFRLREKTVDCKDIVQLVYSFFSHHGSHVGAHKTKEWQPCCFYLRELI